MSHISYVQPYIDELPYYLRDRTYISRYRNSFNSSPAQRLRKDAQGSIKTTDLWVRQPSLQSRPMQIHPTDPASILLPKDVRSVFSDVSRRFWIITFAPAHTGLTSQLCSTARMTSVKRRLKALPLWTQEMGLVFAIGFMGGLGAFAAFNPPNKQYTSDIWFVFDSRDISAPDIRHYLHS